MTLDARVLVGDCLDVMATLDANSVDAIVTDPPYGLEFMGKEWDRFAPARTQYHGERADTRKNIGNDPTKPASRHRVATAMQRPTFRRCATCGKREFSGSPCRCDAPDWHSEQPSGPPTRMMAFQAFNEAWGREALRILKPGAHLVAFGGTRTFHRLMCAIEDAGFEIRDCLSWLYGSGFPKSLDVSKAIDKAAGAERSGVGINPRAAQQTPKCGTNAFGDFAGSSQLVTAPATDAAREWEGWGTALKPAWEPIILARKPLDGTVAANVLAHGTGALNIDACRIETDDDLNGGAYSGELRQCVERTGSDNEPGARSLGRLNRGAGEYVQPLGRWPANVVLDEDAARLVDAASGETISSGGRIGKRAQGVVANVPAGEYRAGDPGFGDSGGASRFFYTAKASRSERNAGLEHLPPRTREDVTGRHRDTPGANNPRAEMTARGAIKNVHPTVKPLDLMQWLCRLVTPRGGLILDPFCGSGTTGRAAIAEGFRFLGIELSDEYAEIARARITDYAPLFMPAESPDLPDDEPTP